MSDRPVTIRALDEMADLVAATRLINGIWSAPLVLPNMARAIQQAGGYVAGAFDDAGTMIGASIGFLGRHGRHRTLHSHVTGVLGQHRGVGARIKQHQHAWCVDHGIDAITWTFDPLVARNGYFNLGKLGAVGAAYLPDNYGAMDDGVNAGDASDRLRAWWAVTQNCPRPAVTDPLEVLAVGSGMEPLLRAAPVEGAGRPLAVQIPSDYIALRQRDPQLASRWRMTSGEVFVAAFGLGYRATGMRRDGTYLLTAADGNEGNR